MEIRTRLKSSATEAAAAEEPPPGKFCIVLTSATRNNRVAYLVFIVDLSCGDDDLVGARLANPTLQIDYGFCGRNNYSNGFCVIGKTLYMFEGDAGENDKISNSVYAIDLSSIDPNTKLDKSSLVKVSEMRYLKSYPVAIATPDGEKIVLFSSQFCMPGKFELYTPSQGVWERIPSLDYQKSPSMMHVGRYGFVGNSVLLVQIYRTGSFVLDLDRLNEGWVRSDSPEGVGRSPFPVVGAGTGPFFVVEGGRFCFTNSGAYDLELGRGCGFPLPSFGESLSSDEFQLVSGEPCFGNSVALVSNDNGEVFFGYLQVRLEYGCAPVYSDLIINLCCADLNEYEALCPVDLDVETRSEIKTRVVKTLRFSSVLEHMDWCELLGFFSIS